MVKLQGGNWRLGAALCAMATLAAPRLALAADVTTGPPKMVAGVDEVMVDLVVRDKKGKLVLDLKPDEIEITDDGKPVKIKNLQLEAPGQAPEAAQAAQNRPVRLVSLVFERLGNDAGKLAREAAEEMLKAEGSAGIYFAVLEINHRLQLIQPYITDRDKLRAAVDAAAFGARSHSSFDADAARQTLLNTAGNADGQQQLLQGNGAAAANGVGPSFAPMMIKILQDSDEMVRDQQSRPSLAALLALAQQQGNLPGRKTIVYFCDGMPLTEGTKDALSRVIAAANRAGVSIYAFDVSGLRMDTRTEAGRDMLSVAANASRDTLAMRPNPNVSALGAGGVPAGGPPTPMDPSADHIRAMDRAHDAIMSDSQSSLINLARGTGGFYIGDSNDLRKAARKLMQDVGTYYEVSYVPDAAQYDGRFHTLAVKVARPSVKVQARNGYLAVPPGTPADALPFEAGLRKALEAQELPRQLDFRAEVVPFGREGSGVGASLVVEVPLKQMETREDGNAGTFEIHPMVLALLKNEKGEVIRKFSQDLPYRGALEAMNRMKSGAYTMERPLEAIPGALRLEVAVGDGLSGKFGAERTSVTIPSVPAGVGISAMSIVKDTSALPEGTAATGERFRYKNVRIIPSLERMVDRDAKAPVSVFFVIYPDEKLKDAPKLELELSRRGQTLGRFPMALAADAAGPIPFIASIPTGALKPGPYGLAAIVTQAGEQTRREMAFTVKGAEIAAPEASKTAVKAPETDITNHGPLLEEPLSISKIDNAARPTPDEQKQMIEGTRAHAVEYESSLPNFVCIQVTHRWRGRGGNSKWVERDTITEMLRYLDGKEVRRILEVNGAKATTKRSDLRGMQSSGEFGGLLRAVFGEKAKAQFTWKELANLGNTTCHVYSFRVDAGNSEYAVGAKLASGNKRMVAFHGLVYIDAARYLVRRIAVETGDLPASFPVRRSSIAVNYDAVQIGEHEHMLPVSADVEAIISRHVTEKNDITFRDYRKFGSESSIKFAEN